MYLKDLVSGKSLIISNVRVLVVVLRGLPLCIFKR
jgi:hypothetical protein